MHITKCSSGERKQVEIQPVEAADLKKITAKRYAFNWKKEAKDCDLYKLTLKGEEDILGLMALKYNEDEHWIEIKLLATSAENVGAEKQYENIAACLIAFAGLQAIKTYADLACIALIPKTELRHHYIRKYGMVDGGRILFLDGIDLIKIIKKYSYA